MSTEISRHYRIVEKLGEGGMGEVYLAEDLRLTRKVAIKFLLQNAATSANSKKRFIREAKAAAALDHPNICTIHEIGEDDGRYFFVMQYVKGETLAHRIKRQPLSLEESIDIAVQVADAINAAHTQGIIHRDLKPQNIMLTPQGHVKVLDFGLAKMIQPEDATNLVTVSLLSNPGVPIGTLPFMSPEQVRVEALTGGSDIFSLGAILYEMITGKPLFARATAFETMSAILTFEPPPISQFKPDAPPMLDQVLRKSLAKDSAKRYESASQFSDDLKTLKRGGEVPAIHYRKPHRFKLRPRQLWLIAGILAAIILSLSITGPGIGWLRRLSGSSAIIKPQAKTTTINTIAALPFITEGNDPDIEFLSRGFTQSLIDSLSRLPRMRVSAYSAVATYDKREVDPTVVGRDLDVAVVAMGRFTLRGESLNVSVELIDAQTKAHLWSHSYSRNRSDILELQREICGDINEQLRTDLGSEERSWLNDQHTDNADAYKLYLKGRMAWGRRTPEEVRNSIEFFNQAIRLDPTYALAYTGLSDAYTTLGVTLPVLPPREAMQQAKAAAEQAISLDPKLADAHTSLAVVLMMYEWDWDRAEREFKKAIELNPNLSSARNWYAYYLIAMGRFDEAEAEGELARQLDPLSLFFRVNKARTFYFSQQFDKVIDYSNAVLGVNQNFHNAHYMLGLAYAQKHDYGKAIESFEKVRSIAGENGLWDAMFGYVYAKAGKRADAEKYLARFTEQARTPGKYIPPVYPAIIYAGLGEREQMFAWLEKAIDERSGMVVYLRIEPVFYEYRADPRFIALLDRIGLKSVPTNRR
jgi:eukaryotic-like serine/threonine-protein kinase